MMKRFDRFLVSGLLVTSFLAASVGCHRVAPPVTQPGGIKSEGAMVPTFGVQELAATEGGAANAGASSDFDGDGRDDAALIDPNASRLNVFLSVDAGGGLTNLEMRQQLDLGNTPRRVLAEDLTGDDIVDLAVANLFSNDVSVALGRGDGTFEDPRHFPVDASGPTDLATADLDGDGVKELITCNAFTSDVTVMKADPEFRYVPVRRFAVRRLPMALAIADMNQDGNLDVVTASPQGPLTVLLGDGTGELASTRTFAAEPPSTFPFARDTWVATDLVVDDFNGDEFLDIAMVRAGERFVTLILGEQTLAWDEVKRRIPIDGGGRTILSEDFNDDGLNDLVVLDGLDNEVAILLQMVPEPVKDPGRRFVFPRFARAVNYLVPPGTSDIVAGRLDPGQRLDLLVAAPASGAVGSASFAMMSSRGTAGVLPPQIASVVPPSGPKTGMTRIEILGLNFQAGARVFVDGLEATGVVVTPQSKIEATTPASARGSGGTVEVRVINPDGGIATRPGAFTYIVNMTPPLSFTRLVFCKKSGDTGPAGFPSQPDCDIRIFKDADAADLSGDGLLDVFAASADNSSAQDQTYVNSGTRTFHPVTNGDGSGGLLSSGLFTVHDAAAGAVQPRYDVQAANFVREGSGEFGDLRLDVFSVDGFSIRVLVNKGNDSSGAPMFQDEAQTRVYDLNADIDKDHGEDPADLFDAFVWDDIDIGDLDLDGDLDIALANRNRKTAFNLGGDRGTFVLLNDGVGNFTTMSLPLAATRADHDVELADIDNDCDLDLVYSGHSGNPPSPPTVVINQIRTSCTGSPGSLSFVEDPSRLVPAAAGAADLGTSFNYVGAEAPSGPLDFNRDGFVDLHVGGSREVLMLNRGSIQPGFFDEVSLRGVGPGNPGENLFPGPAFVYGSGYGDLDLDGRVDIVSGDYDGRPMVFLNRLASGAGKAQIEGMNEPFVEHPTREGLSGRGDPDNFWPSMDPWTEPDTGQAGVAADLDPDNDGFLAPHGPQMGVELRDFDGDNDLDVVMSYGDGGLPRINRVFLNNQPAENAAIGPVRGRNDEGREILHWKDEVTFTCFNTGFITEVRMRIFPAETGGAPQIDQTLMAPNQDQNGDGILDFVFTVMELFPRHGDTTVLFEYVIDAGPAGLIPQDKAQNIYIDPSGVVFDLETGELIVGAEVVLEIRDAGGNWVLPAPIGIQPPVNPQQTRSDGGYGWDVVPGKYRVRVSANGYEPKISREVDIPPPVLDLDVGLKPIKTPHFVWEDSVRVPHLRKLLKKLVEVRLEPDEAFHEELAELAGGKPVRFREAEAGTRFKGHLLNWPLAEIGLSLEPETGVLFGTVDPRQVLAQPDPLFLGLLEVLEAESGDVIAEIWLEIRFVKK